MSNKQTKKYSYAFHTYLSYARAYKLRFIAVIISFILASSLLSIIPIFIGRLVGALAANPVQGHQAVIDVWILILCSVGHNLLWPLSELVYIKLVKPLGYLYENILFKRIIRMPYPYFVDKFTGKMSSYVGSISQELRDFVENVCYNYTSQIVNLVVITAILTSINWQTVTVFLVGIVGMLVVGRHTIKISNKYEKISTDIQSTKNGKIIDAIANFVNIKSFQKEHIEIRTIESEQKKTIKAATQSAVWTVFFWNSLSFFVRNFIWPITIGLNVYLFFHHEISIAQLTTLLSTILLFSSTIWELIWYVSQFNLKLARIEEAHVYLFGKHNIVKEDYDRQHREHLALALNNELVLNKLSFAYPDKLDVRVLNNINLVLKKGEKLGIVGRSGSGKSTLTKLMLGYYPVEKGQITLDDIAVETIDLAELVSYVPQDTSLFHRSIADNIAYAADGVVTREDVVKAAKQAHADEFITNIGEGYEALVGERGVKLSAGQRQRIAIARAMLDNKPLLILDEATSALDSESEILVQRALEALWEHKTVIAIAHRLSTLRHMDRILVMDRGSIVEQGTHDELLEARGLYAKLWAHQSGGFIEE